MNLYALHLDVCKIMSSLEITPLQDKFTIHHNECSGFSIDECIKPGNCPVHHPR